MHFPLHRRHEDDTLHHTESHVQEDGRLNIRITSPHLASRGPRSATEIEGPRRAQPFIQVRKKYFQRIPDGLAETPSMNIAIIITGSRGDVQPFIALAHALQKPPYNHRVRICTHPNFKDFVQGNGLEFHTIGGDPEKLMAYMVKNPGVMPTLDSLRAGEVSQRKAEIAEMLNGSWKACIQAGDGMTKIDLSTFAESKDMLMDAPKPFVADAIIANPPSYGAIHIAEKLGIPLHMMFTMPWSANSLYPHPMANVNASGVDSRRANLLSYQKVEFLTWEGLNDVINHFRERTLMLDPIHPLWGQFLFSSLKVPYTYCFSQALIPRPPDWGDYISIAGFFFLPAPSSFKPDAELQAFLDAGPPPVYIGFGSIVVDDPQAMTDMIFDAVKKAGVRALVSKGWGNIGTNPPDNIYLLGNVPHDWLFTKVAAVVHHGGAGTTAIGIALGKPTVIVPFFGDQGFWGDVVYRAGAGPEPVPYKKLDSDKLAANIKRALEPDVKEKAHELAMRIKDENGPKNAVEFFHSTPQMQDVACFLYPKKVGVWRIRRTNVQLSSLAVGVLVTRGRLRGDQLKLVRHKRWYVEEGAQGPIGGFAAAFGETGLGIWNDIWDFKEAVSGKQDPLAKEWKKEGIKGSPSEKLHHLNSLQEKKRQKKSKVVARATGELFGSVAVHAMKFPVSLLYNVANGFHNAPAFFMHDRTVRVRDNITGIGSGVMVGGKEFGYGLYDAVSGLVTQPYLGYTTAKPTAGHRTVGALKGTGRGVGGLVLKASAAVLGPAAYSLKGLEREIERWWMGADSLLRSEAELVAQSRKQVFGAGVNSADEERNAAQLMWVEPSGAGVGKRIIERRIWEGYVTLKQLRASGVEGEKVEQGILDRWEKLGVEEFLNSSGKGGGGEGGWKRGNTPGTTKEAL